MSKEFVFKKLDQIRKLILEIREFFPPSFSEFVKKKMNIRATERNFQLMVELASDINAHLINESGKSTPDNYWESFRDIQKLGIISWELSKELVRSARLRNILVHEYDFDQDNFIFYKSVKKFLKVYENYIVAIQKYAEKTFK